MRVLKTLEEVRAFHDTRRARGESLAHTAMLLSGSVYLVPSQRGGMLYTVDLDRSTCTCPDWANNNVGPGPRVPCKHIWAARLQKECKS